MSAKAYYFAAKENAKTIALPMHYATKQTKNPIARICKRIMTIAARADIFAAMTLQTAPKKSAKTTYASRLPAKMRITFTETYANRIRPKIAENTTRSATTFPTAQDNASTKHAPAHATIPPTPTGV